MTASVMRPPRVVGNRKWQAIRTKLVIVVKLRREALAVIITNGEQELIFSTEQSSDYRSWVVSQDVHNFSGAP